MLKYLRRPASPGCGVEIGETRPIEHGEGQAEA